VVVVDDGSRPPAGPRLRELRLPYRLVALEQENAGAGAARHSAAEAARGDLLIIVDDDMELPPEFLAEHLRAHEGGAPRAVLGLRLEQAGVQLSFSRAAYTVHASDHGDATWRARAHRYGVADLRIGKRHASIAHADPWRYFFQLPALARPLLATSALAPGAGK